MTVDRDDPRWTAYVLGELEGDDLKELHATLEDSEEARRYVESLREATALLSDELRDGQPMALSDLQRQRIENEAKAPKPSHGKRIALAGSLAAAAGVMLFLAFGTKPEKLTHEPEEVALHSIAPSPDRAALRGAPAGNAGIYRQNELDDDDDPGPSRGMQFNADPNRHDRGGRRRRGQLGSGGRPVNTWREVGGGSRGRRDDPTDGQRSVPRRPPARADNYNQPTPPRGEKYVLTPKGKLPAGLDARIDSDPGHNTEAYDRVVDNDFIRVVDDALSTFSIDVDTASYSNMRRYLTQGMLPPKDSVRIEELINYFSYDYSADGDPFSARADLSEAPWNREHRLLRIGIKGKEIVGNRRPRANLVFLIDVSGSMSSNNKLPLLKQAMRMLVERLDEEDQVAIVVYAGASGLVLPSTSASDAKAIEHALDQLKSGGSTNGGSGIKLAYKTAEKHFIEGGVNRVILATDGDFNVGTTSQGDLVRLIENKAKSGVYLTVLGFGMGNYNDSTLEKLADKGNGNYAYIDTINEARKVLVEEIHSTLVTIAKDVKIQIEFNPARVAGYRLIGYENRVLAHQDFNDDKKDAGDIGAGHTVTALYEIVPAGRTVKGASKVDDLKYQVKRALTKDAASDELLTIKLRFKQPDGDKSTLREFVVRDRGARLADANADFRFAAAVAAFGMLLRDSEHKGSATMQMVLDLAENGIGDDPFGYRLEFVSLVKKAKRLYR